MILDIGLLVVGVVIVVLSADRLVLASAELASRWGVSAVIVGAVIIGFGSSAPELMVSVLALDQPNGLDLAVGNAVGSNIANISLVLAVSVILFPFSGSSGIIKREGALMAAAMGLASFFLWDGRLTTLEGGLLVVALIVSGVLVVDWSRDAPVQEDDETSPYAQWGQLAVGAVVFVAMVALLAGARAMVVGAENIALEIGMSEGVVGLTILALGTSLPELGTVVASARRGRNDLVLGNVLGSNIFNSLAVVGATGLFGAGTLVTDFRPDLVVMVAVAMIAGVVVWSGDGLQRKEGVVLLAAYPVAIWLAL